MLRNLGSLLRGWGEYARINCWCQHIAELFGTASQPLAFAFSPYMVIDLDLFGVKRFATSQQMIHHPRQLMRSGHNRLLRPMTCPHTAEERTKGVVGA